MPSDIPLPSSGGYDSSLEQENLININGPRTPFYILPCPWLIPHPDDKNVSRPQATFFPKNEEEETSVSNQCSVTSSSRTVPHLDNHHLFFPIKVKTEASAPVEARPTNDFNEASAGFAQDGGDQHIRAHSKERDSSATSSIKQEKLDSTTQIETSAKLFHTDALPEKNCEQFIFPSKKVAGAVAAAEARKRRRELTKLKNLHGRQCRMHC